MKTLVSLPNIAAFVVFLSSGAVFADTPSPLQVAQERITVAQRLLFDAVQSCWHMEDQCGINGLRERTMVKWILNELGSYGFAPLTYASETRKPGTFLVDGQVRLAVTGNDWESPILVNEDLIQGPITILEALSMLIHEYGHHQISNPYLNGIMPKCEELDRLASKIRSLVETKGRQIAIPAQISREIRDPHPTLIRFFDVDYADNGAPDMAMRNTMITIETSKGALDVSAPIARLAECPSEYVNGVFNFKGTPLKIFLQSVTKTEILAEPGKVRVRLTVPQAGLVCAELSRSEFRYNSGYKNGLLDFVFVIDALGSLNFSSAESKLSITTPPDRYWRADP